MIKINLLPPQVMERRKVKNLIKLLIVLFLAELAGLCFSYYQILNQETAKRNELTKVTAEADVVRNLETERDTEIAGAKSVNGNLAWYDSIYQHNSKMPDTLLVINEYIYKNLSVRNMTVGGDRVTLSGVTRNLDEVARAYFNLLRSPYITPGTVTLAPSLKQTSSPATRANTGQRAQGGPGTRAPGGPRQRATAAPNSATPTAITGNPNEAMSVQFTFKLLPQYALAGGATGGGGGRGGRVRSGGPTRSAASRGRQ